MTFVKIRRQNSVYYRLRNKAVGSHSRWGVHNPDGLSSYIGNESGLTADARKHFRLPCGKTVAQSWCALRKCWLGFNIAKCQDDRSLMQKYAYRIRKIQAQMGIKSTDFDPEILDENTVTLIDKKYRLQEPQDQELDSVKESRIETTELNYEEIMTGPSTTVKLPDPKENIFTSYYLRSDNSCPSPADRSLAKIDKKEPYYNKSCPSPADRSLAKIDKKEPYYNKSCPSPADRSLAKLIKKSLITTNHIPTSRQNKSTQLIHIDTHVIPYNSQGRPPSVKHDQNNFAVPDLNQPPVYQAIESKSCAMPAQDPIYTIHEKTACPYDSSEGQSQESKKNQDQNNFAVPDLNQPPVYQAIESKARAMPAQDPIYTIHEKTACPYNSSEDQFQKSKKNRAKQRRSKFCAYEIQI